MSSPIIELADKLSAAATQIATASRETREATVVEVGKLLWDAYSDGTLQSDSVWNYVITKSLGEEGRLHPNPDYPGDEFALLVYASITEIVPSMIPGFSREIGYPGSDEMVRGWFSGGLTQLAIRLRRAGQANVEANGKTLTAVPPKHHLDKQHSPDYSQVNWHGEKYNFTPTQARAIEILWSAWKTGAPTVSGQHIVKALDIGTSRTLPVVFRLASGKYHKAWGTLIIPVKGIKGAYCLNDPDDPALQIAAESRKPGKRTGTRIGKRTGTRKK